MVEEIMTDVARAREFAKKKHRCQLRKDCKTPYFNHLEQVVARLERLGIKDKDVPVLAGFMTP